MSFEGYRCSLCGAEFGADGLRYLCPRDGGCLEVVMELRRARRELEARGVVVRLAAVRARAARGRTGRMRAARGPAAGARGASAGAAPAGECGAASWCGESSHWRYLPLLPVTDPGGRGTPFRTVGATPIYSLPSLRARLGLPRLWLKDEGRNPTASLKDRASSLVLARAREAGASVVVTSSTGNAGAALAGMAACLGMSAVILAPRTAPPAKVAQMLVYGARVVLVDGSYDEATVLARRAAEELGWFCRNTGYNPFTAEGKKTAAFEIWEAWMRGELGEAPQGAMRLSIFVPVGDGNIIAGLHKGFRDLQQAGLLAGIPRLFGVQAEGSAAIASAFAAGTERIRAVQARTLADSICVDLPADGLRALRAATRTGGAYLTVSDGQILKAIAELGAAGVFAEPAAAAAWAGLGRALAQALVTPEDPVLVLSTGSGLKDVAAAQRAAASAPVIEPTLEALKKLPTR